MRAGWLREGKDITAAMCALCDQLSAGAIGAAAGIAGEHYPLPSFTRHRRAYTPLDLARTALRDGFVDRYTGKRLVYPGKRLVYPGVLRLLSTLLPAELPCHANWA